MDLQETTKCPFLTPSISKVIKNIANKKDLRLNDLLHRTLLQLPKYSSKDLENINIVEKEIEQISNHLKENKRKIEKLFNDTSEPFGLEDLYFKNINKNIAHIINENLHYIGYDRLDGQYFGLVLKKDYKNSMDKVVSMITLSPFDLDHIRPFLPNGVKSTNVLVVSRIFAFDWAPKNCISYTLGQMYKWLKINNPDIKMLLTYLNPNVCFSGASYRASNWVLFGKEPNIKYSYLNGNYITLRALRNMYNTTDLTFLRSELKNKLELSDHCLGPLEIYVYLLSVYKY